MSDEATIIHPRPRFADWLMDPIRNNSRVYVKVAIAAVMINLFALVTSLFTMTVYDRVLPNNATSSLIGLSIGLAIILIFDFVLKILRAYFVDVAGADIDREIGENVFSRLLTIRLDQPRGSTGGLAQMLRELETLRDFFASATLVAIVDVPFILVTLAVIAMIGGWLVLVPITLIPVVIIVGLATQPQMDRLSAKAMGQSMLKQSVLIETIGGLEMVKSASAGRLLSRRWDDAVESHAATSMAQRLISNISITVAASGQQIAYAGVVVAGVGLIASQSLTMGGLIACSILGGRAVAPLSQIATLLSRMTMTRTAYRQLDRFMEAQTEGQGPNALALESLNGQIEFRNVHFSYPNATEAALNGVSFQINPGEKVAFLGRVGSGKSTIARIILGLYPPAEGLVLIDGTEVRQLDAAQMRRNIGSVLQDTVLLSGTVRDNIVLDRDQIDDEEMLRAARLSGTHDFMGKLANGYELKLADRGESLSGGQRQSIAVARALAGKPSILLLDEPTSAMDNQTELSLIERLQREAADRTMLIITHRLPLLKLVSRIIVIGNGKVVADGPRDTILKQLANPQVSQ
ncbi:type I secretion system permease/ATPase [Sphingorhabdus sp.]|jgi:ATP-binding cassette subfamily C protein LapB|uniref:type I secretion system permease/ATPase n=1 Tax=Sphingorhabdus sp. TaxID=1902408 RepID=UPI003BAEA611|nr:type I secretion system permease/ATPase [Sphingomonadales bacterium]MBK9432378.1 type I secretion system permease/ATPase [Sphingomonadales bacterium]MBL0022084.1 type I secretion system permease/ATPase [Sphingomonadales bacterium]